jgi:toxin ParE1/3/4
MRIAFHRSIRTDLDIIFDYYSHTDEPSLAHDFYIEFRQKALEASERPTSFQADKDGIRRVDMSRFPYNFLFRITTDAIRILVIRHNHRDPFFGSERR